MFSKDNVKSDVAFAAHKVAPLIFMVVGPSMEGALVAQSADPSGDSQRNRKTQDPGVVPQ